MPRRPGDGLTATLLLAAACLGLPAAAVQEPRAASLDAEQQTRLEQLALAKARTELLERVRGLPLSPGLTVGDWLARDPDLDRSLRLWSRTRPRHGHLRLYSDAICEADVRVEPDELGRELQRLVSEYPAAANTISLSATGLNEAARGWPIIWVTGRAALEESARGRPAGWENVTHEGQELARAAATADAFADLLAQAGRLKVTNARRLREFLDHSAELRQAVENELRRAAQVQIEYAPDQVAEARLRLELRDLLRILTKVHQEHYRGHDFEAADFREMFLRAGSDALTAIGLATPPTHTWLKTRYDPLDLDAPEWAARTLSAVGVYEPTGEQPADEATRREAARLDAIDRLYAQIADLVIQRDVRVGDYLAYHPELKDDVALFLSGARVVSHKNLPDGRLEAGVELPLRRLWEIMRRTAKVVEVEPDAVPATQPVPPRHN